ncbi:Uncharacterized protein MCB1EB_1117 [Mycoavidus cysteinexigens]|uniref:Uncharacterized protein n=1 Tax=Mycoavidus cysteinexigens TaxID=1553431 RepID=A0A2Z6EV42_9BURK|nr:DUF3619 family protein [Mycoavidus cysteinexigens]BBE09278.1 Uncharacterized protein MCB1EB_1117 [Mycoavidus cysteinexigens]GAM51965.1 probable transmembrane protein [bacterium endosymbiont of Mortierella elongata FMR23-6]GLR02064.1 hypothetical protein GCM10007934_18780 [Mycoavidus cysteinexigens]
MSSALDTKEVECAHKICALLDTSVAQLPETTLAKLAQARRSALAAQKPEKVRQPAYEMAFASGLSRSSANAASHGRRLFNKFGLIWPLLALLAGLSAITYWADQQRAAEIADIDAAILSDELPLNAYLDHGFRNYLSDPR